MSACASESADFSVSPSDVSTSSHGTRDFGSFHASNVQELTLLPEDEYNPPEFPFKLPAFDEYKAYAQFTFGRRAKEKHFYLEDSFVFLNHGAFGAALKQAVEVAQEWQVYIERQPLRFYDRCLLPHLVHITRRLAKFVGCDAQDLVLVPNVTTAVNTILHAQCLNPGDNVFLLSCEYGAVKKIVKKVCADSGAKIIEAQLDFPIRSAQQILDLVEITLDKQTKLAVFDHIPSNTPFLMPIEQLVQICHSKGVRVLVDGAHVLGGVPLSLKELGVDYYTSNAHKWFCAAKGAAFMYVRRDLQTETRPLVVSHGLDSGFSSEFIWSGLRDYSPLLALHTNLDFYDAVGCRNIFKHNTQLVKAAGDLLVKKWGSAFLVTDPSLIECPLWCVRLPSKLYSHCKPVDYSVAEKVQNALFHRFSIEVPVKAVCDHLYVRISAHIYNELEEYSVLADAVLSLTEEQYLKQ